MHIINLLPAKYLTLFILSFFILSCSGGKNYLPETIGGLTLKQKITGAEAASRVNKLHFNPVASEMENEIGIYEGSGNNSAIYITIYKDEEGAKADFEKMTKKISPQNSVFLSPDFIEFEGYKVYRCFGMGQTHYVFVHKTLLFWISTGTISSRDFLKEYIRFIY